MKISYKEWAEIHNYKLPHKLMKYFCNFYIKEFTTCEYELISEIKLPIYIIIFIPIHLLKIIYCIWDMGLKNFCIEPRTIRRHVVSQWDIANEHIEKIIKERKK